MFALNDFEDVHLEVDDAVVRIHDRIGDDLVEGIHRGAVRVSARAEARRAGDGQTVLETGSGNRDDLGGLLLFHDIRIGSRIHRVLHGGDDRIAGHGRVGDDVHIGGVGFHDLGRELVDRVGADVRGFVVAVHGDGGDLVRVGGDGHGQLAAKALGLAGEGVRLRKRSDGRSNDCPGRCILISEPNKSKRCFL